MEEADAEHVLISAAHDNRSHHHPRQVALDTYELFGAAAEDFYSTSLDDTRTNHIVLTIGPNRDQLDIDGAETDWTYWRDLRGHVGEDTPDPCPPAQQHDHYCLETR